MRALRLAPGDPVGPRLGFHAVPTFIRRSRLREVPATSCAELCGLRTAVFLRSGRLRGLIRPIPLSVWISLQTGITAGACYELARVAGLSQGYWAGITAIVVVQSDFRSTEKTASDRVIGSAIGAVLGWLFGSLGVTTHALTFGLAVTLAVLVCRLLGLENASRISGLTVAIVMLAHSSLPLWKVSLYRFVEISLGVIVAVSVSWCAALLQKKFPNLLEAEKESG